jgi:D-tyrosyl-tRNA(Tyr) deacylase
MIAVVQRVRRASVQVARETVGSIGRGLLVYLGVVRGDDEADAACVSRRITALRVFEDDEGRMNQSLQAVSGGVLLVSQFTLCADLSRGRRPSFNRAAPPARAEELYLSVCSSVGRSVPVQQGRFGAAMVVQCVNEGPATFILDTNSTTERA